MTTAHTHKHTLTAEEDTTSAKTCASHIGHALHEQSATGRVPRVWRQITEPCTDTETTKLRFGVHSIVHTGYHSAVPCFDAARCTGKKVKPLLVKEKEGKKKKKRVIKRRRRRGDFCICMCVCVFVCRLDTNFLFTCTTSKCTLAHMYIHWHWLTDSLN